MMITDVYGCVNSMTYVDYITIDQTPSAEFRASSIELSTLDTEVQFFNQSILANSYNWSFGDESSSSTVTNPSHFYPSDSEGSYDVQLIAYSLNGCTDTAFLTINVIDELVYFIPNTFTPDGDEFNQNFRPIFVSGYDPYDFNMTIFNRWGEQVFETNDVLVGWDGAYLSHGGLVQEGVYTWRIEFKASMNDERIILHGHVNILK